MIMISVAMIPRYGLSVFKRVTHSLNFICSLCREKNDAYEGERFPPHSNSKRHYRVIRKKKTLTPRMNQICQPKFPMLPFDHE
jgi:hypothetical protein